jgi:predicted small metal-binding protein
MAENCKVLDCRWFPADIPCEFAISGNEEEVLNIAVRHSVDSHGYRDTPELREQLRALLRDDRRKRAVYVSREERRKAVA